MFLLVVGELVRDVALMVLLPVVGVPVRDVLFMLPLPVAKAVAGDIPHGRIADNAVNAHVVLANSIVANVVVAAVRLSIEEMLALDRYGMEGHTQVAKQVVHALDNHMPDDLERVVQAPVTASSRNDQLLASTGCPIKASK